jgi:hypothetical protein
MSKYSVLFKRTLNVFHSIEVEAENEHEAREKAESISRDGFNMSDFLLGINNDNIQDEWIYELIPIDDQRGIK